MMTKRKQCYLRTVQTKYETGHLGHKMWEFLRLKARNWQPEREDTVSVLLLQGKLKQNWKGIAIACWKWKQGFV